MPRFAALFPFLIFACGAQASVTPSPVGPPAHADEPTAPTHGSAEAPPAKGATQIDCGDFHTCARMTDGSARCWGRNDHGQLGDGTTTDRAAPVTVAGLRGVVEVAAGTSFTCARLEDGGLRCWGTGRMLGDGASRNNLPPTPVPQISGATEIRAAGLVTCARTAGGARCWGLEGDVRRAVETIGRIDHTPALQHQIIGSLLHKPLQVKIKISESSRRWQPNPASAQGPCVLVRIAICRDALYGHPPLWLPGYP
jgi:hypothetical protein